ncbi:MAG: phosphate acyltransferase [Bdellovibrionota bacterium]
MLFTELSITTQSYLIEKSKNKRIALPEGEDPRVLEAARILKNEYHVQCELGSPKYGQSRKQKTLSVLHSVAQKKGKPLSEKIEQLAEDATFAAGAALSLGEVDAVISGCCNTTSHVIRAALNTVGLKKETKIITSAFLLSLLKPTPGGESLVLYSDCAVIPKPTSEELCSIAYLAGQAYSVWTNTTPKISFLSFSTMGSAEHAEIDIVKQATSLFCKNYPDILCDGEVQFDSACVPDVSKRKNPGSKICGGTNVFIFPDLNSGNIGYKMTQYIGGAKAWGPTLLGAAKPFSDLSRGASALDIAHSVILVLALAV